MRRTTTALLLCTCLAHGQGLCGDCDDNGALSILDALAASQIAVGLPVPSIPCGCDTDDNGSVGVVDALLIAQRAAALPALLVCDGACATNYRVLPCGQAALGVTSITANDLGAVANFDLPGTTAFFAIPSPPPDHAVEIRLSGMSVGTNLDLYLAAPGTAPGETDSSRYTAVLGLADSSPEVHVLQCPDVTAFGGFAIPIAVHAVVASPFDLTVTCFPSPCPQLHHELPCGARLSGALQATQGTWPPLLSAGPDSVQFFAIPRVSPEASRIELVLDFPAGDLDLMVGDPGTNPADVNFGNYGRSSTILRPERIVIDGQSTPPIQNYHGLPLAIAVTGFSGTPPLDFSIEANCMSTSGVELIPCGFAQDDIATLTAGTAGGPIDLMAPGASQFYGIVEIPETATQVAISLNGMTGSTDIDLLVAAPGATPGASDPGAYAFRSQAAGNADEFVLLDCASLFAQTSSRTIAVVAHARVPGLFDLRVDCFDLACPCADTPAPVWQGECLTGSVPVEDRFTFYAAVGEAIEVTVDTFDDLTTFDPAVALFEPGSSTPATIAFDGQPCYAPPVTGECPVLTHTTGATGMHTISVKAESPLGPSGIGNYVVRVRVSGLAVPPVLSSDDIPESW